MYLFISTGLILTIWPDIIFPDQRLANQNSVVQALLGALALVSLLGIRYPLKMLPILIFELIWKLIWVLGFALPIWMDDGLDIYASETLFACIIGVVLVPIAIPWRHAHAYYLKAKTT